MAIESNQQALQLGILYKIDALSKGDIQRDLSASIWVDSGSVDVYASDSATQPTTLAEMTLNTDDVAIAGKAQLVALPNYIAIVQNQGTSTELVLTGVKGVEQGAIA